ncbi:MAG: selenium-dependent molybdenum cofactor biosynthesis protein YqeB [Anaerotruncus massiliensis (ex Togo et al. 2019)]
MLIFIKGAGDLATGVAWRLHNCGFQVVMTDIARPTAVRCTVAFSRAVYEGAAEIEGVTARLARDPADALRITGGRNAVLVDPQAAAIETLRPRRHRRGVAKRNLGTRITAPVVIALGPSFTAGADCHAVVETKRGHYLGRVIYAGSAIANTGVPGDIGGYTSERIIRAPADGPFAPAARIGQLVRAGDVVARVEGEPVRALIDGVVRGMLPEGTPVTCGMKSGDIDPRGIVEYCHTISDKARAIAGGALEAVLHLRGGVL